MRTSVARLQSMSHALASASHRPYPSRRTCGTRSGHAGRTYRRHRTSQNLWLGATQVIPVRLRVGGEGVEVRRHSHPKSLFGLARPGHCHWARGILLPTFPRHQHHTRRPEGDFVFRASKRFHGQTETNHKVVQPLFRLQRDRGCESPTSPKAVNPNTV